MKIPRITRLGAAGVAVILISSFVWWRAHTSAAAPAAPDVIVSVQAAKAQRGPSRIRSR